MSLKLRSLAMVSSLLLALVASDDADAEVALPPDLFSVHHSTTPPLTLPPEPPLPAGCVKPTAENCADSAWLASDACAKDPGKTTTIRTLCNWTILKAWNDANSAIDPTLFPRSAPNTIFPPPLLTPAQRVEHGKRLTAQPSSRPGEKRRFPGMAPHGQIGLRTPSPATLALTPKTARGGGGSYATLAVPHVVPSLERVHRDVGTFRGVPAKSVAGNRVLTERASGVSALLFDRPSFVSANDSVSSCEEYAYKRYGDYSRYSFGAKRLGRNYRQAYNLGMDPRSPSFINKATLNQIGVGPMPRQIGPMFQYLPVNAFIAGGVAWLDRATSTTDARGKALITDLQKATVKALVAVPHPLQARTDTTPLGLHREMKALFDSKYDPLDDELDDIAKRTSIYLNLLHQRAAMAIEDVCTGPSDPCHRCTAWVPPPPVMPSGLQGLRDKIGGAAVINPADLKDLFHGDSKYVSFAALTQMKAASASVATLRAAAGGASGGGLKQKGAPVSGQVRRGGPQPQVPPLKSGQAQSPQAQTAQSQCMNTLAAKHAQTSSALTEIERQLTRLLVNELAFGDRSCLADPRGALGNLCDWSYQQFVLTTSSMFDADVERDFVECRAHVSTNVAAVAPTTPANSQFPMVLRNAVNQPFVFPCTQRRDFTTNAASVYKFLDLENDEWKGRSCEAMRQNTTIGQQQDAIQGAMTGIQWDPGSGKIYDKKGDTQTLGDPSTLGASFAYDSYWEMTKTGALKDGNPMKSCRFTGAAHSNADAKIQFFGTELKLATLDGATSTSPSPTISIAASYLDIDTMSTKKLVPDQTNRPLSPGESYVVALADPPVNLGGIEYSFWFTIGPIPIHVVFGAAATAGADYQLEGSVGDNCGDLTQSSNFKLVAEAKPYVRADAFADASVDVGVASGGVRLDLNLMNLSLPIGVHVTSAADGYHLKNGGKLDIDMLAGHLSAYVEVGVSPLDVSYGAEIFGWDGFHTSVPIFGIDKQLTQDVVRTAMAGRVTSASASCKCIGNQCCSNVTCTVAQCMPGTVAIGGERYTCSFNAADIAAMGSNGYQCTNYVK